MGYMIEIREDKVEKLSDHIEKGLHHLGRAMSCVEGMLGNEYGDRGGMNYRESENDDYGRYGKHSGGMNERYPYMGGSHIMYRNQEEDEYEMGERRRRRSNGRYY